MLNIHIKVAFISFEGGDFFSQVYKNKKKLYWEHFVKQALQNRIFIRQNDTMDNSVSLFSSNYIRKLK